MTIIGAGDCQQTDVLSSGSAPAETTTVSGAEIQILLVALQRGWKNSGGNPFPRERAAVLRIESKAVCVLAL